MGNVFLIVFVASIFICFFLGGFVQFYVDRESTTILWVFTIAGPFVVTWLLYQKVENKRKRWGEVKEIRKRENYVLPENIICPHCGRRLLVDMKGRVQRRFNCAACKNIVDMQPPTPGLMTCLRCGSSNLTLEHKPPEGYNGFAGAIGFVGLGLPGLLLGSLAKKGAETIVWCLDCGGWNHYADLIESEIKGVDRLKEHYKFPEKLSCPFCNVSLVLELNEQIEGSFICPNCNKHVSIGGQ
jgi:uncharacterized protein YbaR (Trm112 family)